MRLPEDHEMVEAFFFDGADKPFRVRVTVGGAVRRVDDANSRRCQRVPKRLTPFRIAVTD